MSFKTYSPYRVKTEETVRFEGTANAENSQMVSQEFVEASDNLFPSRLRELSPRPGFVKKEEYEGAVVSGKKTITQQLISAGTRVYSDFIRNNLERTEGISFIPNITFPELPTDPDTEGTAERYFIAVEDDDTVSFIVLAEKFYQTGVRFIGESFPYNTGGLCIIEVSEADYYAAQRVIGGAAPIGFELYDVIRRSEKTQNVGQLWNVSSAGTEPATVYAYNTQGGTLLYTVHGQTYGSDVRYFYKLVPVGSYYVELFVDGVFVTSDTVTVVRNPYLSLIP